MDFTYNACVNETLLQTKLYIPPLRPSLLPRPRLLAKLGHGLDPHTAFFSGRIALICAPAGYGKTTLVGEWLAELTSRNSAFHRQNGRVGWLSLDEQDNDAARFLTYLIAALQRAVPDLGKEVQTALASTQPVSISTLITYLVNDLARLEQPLVLVLDDYHQIREQEIHHAITFLLDNQPPNLYLVLTARRNPPFPLARWRARGHLLEVRQADLKFTRPEIETFFQQATGVNLDQNSLDTLEQRTEGWVASLQLAAIAVQTPEDQPGAAQINKLISSFSGTHQYIADYLLSEVMAQRPSGTRQFLLQTAILERFSASLCAAVTGQEDSQATIEQLQAANLFLIPLDEERHWYRYHHLFAALLRQRLQAQDADQVPQLYLRASLWHEAHGYWEEAIEAALAGGHLERAAGLISDVAQTAVWQQGQYGRLARWIGQLPQGQTTSALSALTHALSLAEAGGYVRLFVDEGAVMADLLQQLPEAPYRDSLLTHFPPTLAADQKLAAPLPLLQALRDPLTGRELEVLRLMTSHLSGPGIARELHISINTYKSHIKNIYGKLNVRSREDAVSRAQVLRLI